MSRNQCVATQSPAPLPAEGADTNTSSSTNTISSTSTPSTTTTTNTTTSTAQSQRLISEATTESRKLLAKGTTDCSTGESGAIGPLGEIVGGGLVGKVNDGIIFGKRIPGSSCAEREKDTEQGSPTCCHHQKRIKQPPIEFDDEFEEYRARANSGGSLYGLLRRQQNIYEEEVEETEPYKGRPKRQRSKSLVPNPDSTLKLFPGGRRRPTSPCECMDNTYLISPKPPRHPRRFSAACVDARDVISKHNITVSISPPPGSPHSTDSSWIAEIDEELSQIEELSDSFSQATPSPHITPRTSPRVSPRGSPAGGSPIHGPYTEAQSGALDLLKPPGLFPLSSGKSVDDLRQTVYRRRSFCITSKGIINEGDFFVDKLANTVIDASSIGSDLDLELGMDRSRASSFNSQGSALWSGASSDTQCHRVLVLGAAGVGKTSLTQQFCTSEYMGAQNTSFDVGVECTVPVLLDGEESIIDFIDIPDSDDLEEWSKIDVQAYIVVYSVTSRKTFQKACDLMFNIRNIVQSDGAMILVANKCDLKRSRCIPESEGRSSAESFDTKYIEVSAILNHKVDDLLVGTLKQIRLNPERKRRGRKPSKPTGLPLKKSKKASNLLTDLNSGAITPTKDNALVRMLKIGAKRLSKSCENLLAL